MPAAVLFDANLIGAVLAGVLGALIGSFANVVIHRLPKGASIVLPGSHCPRCQRRLGPLELVPLLSWLAQRGRCRGCGSGISVRYPLIELLTAAGFVAIFLRWPPHSAGAAGLALLAVFAALVMLAAIDIDTYTLPDVLTLPALALALLASWLQPASGALPAPGAALAGAAVGAGIISLVNRLGGLALRRGRDTRERLWPLGFDQVNLAALGGALGGWAAGVALAAASLVANLLARRPLRLSEPLVLGSWLLALLLAAAGIVTDPARAVAGTFVAAGAAALAGAAYWWLRDLLAPAPVAAEGEEEEPIAMGFGDAKLAAVLGALLGWEKLLVMLFLAFLLGAVGGVTGRLLGGERTVPFGPYLVAAGLLALFAGDALLGWYLGLLGL